MNYGFWSGKRVFLTGHTGFKGSWLSLWLHSLGAKVTGYSIDVPTNPSLFEILNLQQDIDHRVGDVCDLKNLESHLNETGPDIVIHLAAQSKVLESYFEPVKTFETNIMGTVNLLEALRETSVRACLVVTSDKCYENKNSELGNTEGDPLGGHDPYSASKASSELVTESFRNSYFMKGATTVATARAGNVIGGGDWTANRLVPDIMKAYLSGSEVEIRNPDSIRPWQFVLEPLAGYLSLCERLYYGDREFSGAWNFGPESFEEVSFVTKNIYKALNQEFYYKFKKEEPSHQETSVLKLNSCKSKKMLKYEPKLDLQQSLQWTSDWYKNYKNNFLELKKFTLEQIKNYEQI